VKPKRSPKLNRHLIAAILVDAELNPRQDVCEDYGITRMALWRYQKRLQADQILGRLVTQKLEALRPAPPLPTSQEVIQAAYTWLKDNLPKLHPNAENVQAVVSAVKTLRQQEMAERAMTEYIAALHRNRDDEDDTRDGANEQQTMNALN
jgi:GTPase involved in cell partitioning and DNA repair